MRSIRLTIIVLVLLVTAALPARGTTTPDDPTAGEPPGELSVTLTAIEPAVLRPGDDLVVRGTVTNDTAATVTEPQLQLRAQQRTPISRSMLERWLQPDSYSSTNLLAVEALAEPLEPGMNAAFNLRVPADELRLSSDYYAWGPRGLEVRAADATDPLLTPATARNYLLWWPDLEVETMPLAVLGALTPTASERTAAQLAGTPVGQAAAARLTNLLGALDRAAVDVAVDPSLLVDPPAATPLTGPAPTDADTPADATPAADDVPDDVPDDAETATEPPSDDAAAATAELREAIVALADAPQRTLHVLPWADADVAALTHAGRTDLLDDGAELTRDALERSGLATAVSTDLAWPAAAQPDTATLATAAETGASAVVLPSSSLEVLEQLTYTPSGRADVAGSGWQMPAVVVDDRLSALLIGEHLPFLTPEEPAAVPLDPLTARQLLLAETAVITRERPTDRRDMVLAVPRDFTGSTTELAERLSVLADAPWLDRVDLAEVLRHEPPADLDRTALPERVVEDGEVTADELDRAGEALERTRSFAGILEDPAALVDPFRSRLLDLPSAAWRELPDGRTSILEAAETEVEDRRDLVAARTGSTLNLINAEAHIPVAVSNDLDQPANVRVVLRPGDPRLMAPDAVALTVPPHETSTAQIPVRAIGSGDVVVEVILESPDGAQINDGTEIQVRVRADWETVGTAIVAGLLVVLLVAGVVRTVRRSRQRPAHARDGAGATS